MPRPLTIAALAALALCFVSSMPAVAAEAAAKVAKVERPPQPFAILGKSNVPDGRLMAPFYDYVIWPHAVVAKGKVFCFFSNAQGQPIAMAYDTAKKTWAGPVKVSTFGLKNDDHGNPAVCVDGDGHLHVFYGCHGGPMRHARSEKPYDIASWSEAPSPTPKATYPQAMRLADGTVLLFYRAGGHMEPWTMRASRDDMQTWSEGQRIVEMRLDPPDRLAAAYCCFLPGADGRTAHAFWCHKDDNAVRVGPDRPHPWRPLKYPGMHEAVYRYNVYYLKRHADGQWLTAAGQSVSLPVSKAEADAKCLVYDSGDELTMFGRRLVIDADDRPYIRFATGVYDWVKHHGDPQKATVPLTDRFAHLADGRWHIARELPDAWPADVKRLMGAPGPVAYGDGWPGGRWHIFAQRRAIRPDGGCSVCLYNDEQGYVVPAAGPAMVE